MTVELRSLTPPKFVEALREKEAPLLLEERLAHFVNWVATERDIHLVDVAGREIVPLDGEQVTRLIEEYVNE